MKKKCKDCNKTKDIKDFYLSKRGYYDPYCRECKQERTNLWKKNNSQRYKEWGVRHRARPGFKEKHAKYYREWYVKYGRKRAKNYTEVVRLWHKLNPEKCKTSWLVQRAIKIGKIKKPKICEICKEKRKLVAHHDDYNLPLKVRWFCYSCHKNKHIRMNNEKKNT